MTRDRTLNVKIPKGIRDGQQIRLAGQGAPGMGKGKAGDLFLEVELRPGDRYRVDNTDVYLNLPVAPWEAALGSSIRVPTLGGTVTLKVPAGSQTGRRLRLKGRGLPGSPPGDQYAVLNVVLPPADTEADKSRYREMAEHMDFNPRAALEAAS